MSSIKPLSRVRIELISWLGATLLKCIAATLRWQIDQSWIDGWNAGGSQPVVMCFWHDQQLMLVPVFYKLNRGKQTKGLCALTSRHPDGRVIGRVLERLGMRTVAGSSSRGGAVALHALAKVVEEGYDVGITPDGPKGPRHVLKDGPVKLAQLTGVKVMVVAYVAEKYWTFNSWDKMTLPKPFSRIFVHAGTLTEVPKNLDENQFKAVVREIEGKLNQITEAGARHEFTS